MTTANVEGEQLTSGARRSLATIRSKPWIPVYLAIIVLFVASRWIVGPVFTTVGNFWTIVTLASFVAVLGAGEGLVILVGGIDLSIPWVMTLAGVLTTAWSLGGNGSLITALPAILLIGAAIGAINGLAVVYLGIAPVVVTIAMNVLIQGVVLIVTGGHTIGFAPPFLNTVAHGQVAGIPILVLVLIGFAILVGVLMSRTTFGRYAYAVGNSPVVARLSGVPVNATLIAVYAFSGLTASLAGILLTGYAGHSALGTGDAYLLPTIAAVVVGGASILGGRGHYIGTLGAAIFLSLLQTVILALNLPDATRDVMFGGAILIAVLAVRERER